MPATVTELLKDKPSPVTAQPLEPLPDALARMVKHGYSQLPVVDGENRPVAIITADSIVRALHQFNVAPDKLRVLDAMNSRCSECEPDENVVDYLDKLQKEPALFVVDPTDGKLAGILTSHDTTNYFYRRAQDNMLVQDIEETIKSYIQAAFGDGADPKLSAAIEEITPSNKDLLPKFRKAVALYLEKAKTGNKLDGKLAEEVFMDHLYYREQGRQFGQLTLNDYIQLLVSESRWDRYRLVLHLDPSVLRELLESVRKTRNALAHFRTDISEEQRERLRFCRDWLERNQEGVRAVFAPPREPNPPTPDAEPASPTAPGEGPPEEVALPGEGRYGKLSEWLEGRPAEDNRATLSFEGVEKIIGATLPTLAREHRSWWGNDREGNPQSKQWLDAGWRVADVNFSGRSVVFSRTDERGEAYLTFFTQLQEMVKEADPAFGLKLYPPSGRHWTTVGQLPDTARRAAFLNFSFTRYRQFRVELYIDSTDKGRNKQVFDGLLRRKAKIETDLGVPLGWERMGERRASRIALYLGGTITDSDDKLVQLKKEGCEQMLRFGKAMKERLAEVEEELASKAKEDRTEGTPEPVSVVIPPTASA